MMLVVVVALMAFSLFAFTRMEASDGVKYRARIAEFQSVIVTLEEERRLEVEELAAKVPALASELECYEAESSSEGEPCS